MPWIIGLLAIGAAVFVVRHLFAERAAGDRTANVDDADLSSSSARLDRIRDRALSAPSELTEQTAGVQRPVEPPAVRPILDNDSVKGMSLPQVRETVSVILRKQIPPRAEPARSWLGGLPMLPADVEWPRGTNPENKDAGRVPLHFIAQVACADLPTDLWGGLGPRSGWLLLFVNGNTCLSDDPETWRVLHTPDIGAVRNPPTDIGPLHDGMYTGATDYTLRETVYPRWPVDLISVENQLRMEGQRALAAPENFASILYDGAPVAEEMDLSRRASEGRAAARQQYLNPELRALIPPEEIDALEASFRMLHENRPHRMGGYHDGLQSDAQPGPASTLLLMQFAVDEALEWVWGDNGAVYCFIGPQDLASGAFDRAQFFLECH